MSIKLPNKTTYDNSTRIWSGAQNKSVFEEYSSLGQAIYENMKKNPETISQISDTDKIRLTSQEMLTISIRIAQRLEIEKGSILGIMAIGSTYQAPVLLAALLKGIVAHPIIPFSDKKATKHVVGITRPKIIFCDANNYEILMAACKEVNHQPKVFTIKGRIEGVESVHDLMEPTGREDDFRPHEGNQDDTALIMGSSGTTGQPKAVCVSHKSFLHWIENILFRGKVIFPCANVGWISGVIYLLFGVLCDKTRICTEELYSPQLLRQLIEKYDINYVMMASSSMARFIKSGEANICHTSGLRSILIKGLAVSHPLYVKMQECLKDGIIYNSYGGTEFGRVSINCSIKKPKSVGKMCNGVKVRIVDENGNNLGIGETGEILVWNNMPWGGYYNNPTATKSMLDSDGWFHTGDIGLFDEDGDLHFIDRKKDVMRYRGTPFSARDIENCILSLSDVAEVCVFATRTDEFEDLATAAVIRKSGSKITDKEIIDHVANELSLPMWLHGGVYFVEAIPQTTSGKYQRLKIRDMCVGNEIKSF